MKTCSMKIEKNDLYIGECKLKDLAEKYKTPLYVYDEVGIEKKINIFKENFKSNMFECEVVYASKAFIAPYLCDMIKKANFSIDSIGIGDLYLLEKNNFPANKIVLHGNNKSVEEIEKAILMGVEYIVVDSFIELQRVDRIANSFQRTINTLFRVNPGIHAHTHAYIVTSALNSKFGESIFDEEMLANIARFYKSSKYLKLNGFHAHIGSQINNPKSFVAEVKTMIKFVKEFSEKNEMEINVLDLGGGFGIKYLDSDIELELETILSKIVTTCEILIKKNKLKINKIMIEPGRSLVGDSGITLYTCGGTKKTFGGKQYAFVDGGMVDNIRPALYKAEYTIDVANKQGVVEKEIFDVVGKCCESGDIIAVNTEMPKPEEGDIIITYSTGAYCHSMSMNYNGLLRGAVIFVNNDKVTVAVERETADDFLKTYKF